MDLRELIGLLRHASEVKEIDKYRAEITELIPETRRMVDFNQQNYAHQYDLWEHSLQTVVGLPKIIGGICGRIIQGYYGRKVGDLRNVCFS